jgi:hypothetical protein
LITDGIGHDFGGLVVDLPLPGAAWKLGQVFVQNRIFDQRFAAAIQLLQHDFDALGGQFARDQVFVDDLRCGGTAGAELIQ